ncbi:unnamed protein product [Durusdinium trenchii]|uniref:Uncharacterized protein n=1 Tax=Durusdinium trenchii TaxID=1381693 RepID=A0ABP0ND26_9DINO
MSFPVIKLWKGSDFSQKASWPERRAVKRNIVRQMYEAHPDYAGAKAALAGQTGKKRKAGPMDMEDTFILGDINC